MSFTAMLCTECNIMPGSIWTRRSRVMALIPKDDCGERADDQDLQQPLGEIDQRPRPRTGVSRH